jgi:2-desacetyl-2-hydroxyethyl bacteriochlorophyllide A dehydrogenase
MKKTFPMAVVNTPGKIEFQERSITGPSHDQVLIKTKAVSICGSDLHTFKGKHPFAQLPAALGHELSGEVIKVGEAVKRLKVGDRVALEPVITCGQCVFCQKGTYNLCTNISFHHREGQGAFTPFFVANEKWLHNLPKNISFEEGALLEPLAVAVHAVQKSDIALGDTVAIFGVGAIGLMILVLSRLSGASDIITVDVQDFRLMAAREMGTSLALNNRGGRTVDEIIRRVDGLGVDVAFEAVGIQTTFAQSLQVLRKGGHAILVGLNPEPEVILPSNIFVQKEISLSGSQGYCWDFQTALKLVETGSIDLSRFISQRVPFDSLQEGFEILTRPQNQAIKVVVVFD